MRSITKQLDMSPGAVSPVVHVSQYDSDFTIVFTLYCTDGTFTIESGTTAEIRGTKKSGTGYSATATVNISAKTVTVAGHKQMSAVAGDNVYEITLYKGSKELNSINFVLAVERAAMDQDTVVDETTIREFGELKTYIEGVKADTAASASAANASQTAAANSASASAQSAIEAAQSAQSVDAERLNRIAFGSYVAEESTGPIAHFEDGADNIPMKDVLVHIEPVQEGSGDPSPDNIRPITGWTRAKVTRCGKNLLPNRAGTHNDVNGVSYDVNADGTVTVSGTATTTTSLFNLVGFGANNRLYLPEGDYVISGDPVGNNNVCFGLLHNVDNGNWYVTTKSSTQRFHVNKGDYVYPRLRVGADATVDATFSPTIYRVDDEGAEYEPYSGSTYSITFPSEAGTVYGGTLDVTSGVLTVDRAFYSFTGSETLAQTRTNVVTATLSPTFENSGNNQDKTYCSHYKTSAAISWNNLKSGEFMTAGKLVGFYSSSTSDFSTYLSAQNSAGTPVTIAAVLATPQTYQLTPQEITSLLGTNNMWADTGDTEVEYRADTTLYIGRLTEPDADMIADSNITSGQYFMVGNSLYRATSNIASGASVVVGTNAVKVSLATALNEINQ